MMLSVTGLCPAVKYTTMNKLIIILLFILPHIYAQEQSTALLLIDIQGFYFDEDKSPLEGNLEAARQAGLLLENFRKNKQPVIHVMHKGGGDIHELVAPAEGEKVILKESVSCFRETELLDYLQTTAIDTLVIAGMMTHMCVEAATRAAADLGFQCILVHDACATKDLKFGDEIVKARDVHLATLSTLGAYAKVISVREYLDN